MSKNLWPDFELKTTIRSPRAVIAETGSGLKDKTNGLIEFYVSSAVNDGIMKLSCTLWVIELKYHFPFLLASFPVEKFYPVKLAVHDIPSEISVTNEQELIAGLDKIFNAPTTIETIQKLISLSLP